MSPGEQLDALLVLARELELEVRPLGRGGEAPQTSGVCRLRDRVFVMLAPDDPPERRVEVLAAALRENRAEACESRYLQPALRALLEP